MVDYDNVISFVRMQRPRALTTEERLDILYIHACYRKQGVKAVAQLIADILGVVLLLYVWQQYNTTNTIIIAAPPSNRKSQESRVPDTKLVLQLIQNFLREQR
ncbi:hypothetical protein THRCLA_21160 [Thraustotheca clavata]|uniref:Uncharacterized protein n=1 Tax=Thraustotheca clavata TaxID=74557 RepID=A0A1V9ZZL4_9STRA|nr:hypothetical protein THRCLA_21160 [Thraustotheca clavata]